MISLFFSAINSRHSSRIIRKYREADVRSLLPEITAEGFMRNDDARLSFSRLNGLSVYLDADFCFGRALPTEDCFSRRRKSRKRCLSNFLMRENRWANGDFRSMRVLQK